MSDELRRRPHGMGDGIRVDHAAADRIDALEHFLFGGPCPTCGGSGQIVKFGLSARGDTYKCPNPDCNADDWRTKLAKDAREEARQLGYIPMLVRDYEVAAAMAALLWWLVARGGWS